MAAVDRNYLLALARRKSTEGRKALAETISDIFADSKSTLSDRERALIFDILHKVVREVETSVRQHLSERLAREPNAPPSLMALLANDEIEVAYPVLTRSPVLRDSDLIEVIRNRTLEHQLAIAMRYSLSEDVCDALVETEQVPVIETLLKNENANISQSAMTYLVEQSRRVDAFQQPLLGRSELGPELAKRMFLWVSAALRRHIADHFDFDPETVDSLLAETARLSEPSSTAEGDGTELATALDESGMITPAIMIKALKDGEVSLFVSLFAQRTGLRRTLVLRILFEPGGEGLAIACKAIEMQPETFTKLFVLSRKARPQLGQNINLEKEKVLSLYHKMSPEAASQVVARWRLDADYLAALRDLELGHEEHA